MDKKAAFIISQSVCALIDALGMVAENDVQKSLGQGMAFDHAAFLKMRDEYKIGLNDVLDYLQD